MSSYHIDQSGRVVKLVPETKFCKGCLYEHDRVGGTKDCGRTAPVESQEDWLSLCNGNGTIFKLVDTTE
jgi:hypothetical protein